MENYEGKRVMRSFKKAWLNDDRLKSWIEEVPTDKSVYYCSVCDRTFACGSLSNTLRHGESASHKRNLDENTSPSNNNLIVNPKPPILRAFRRQWLKIEEFKPWLHSVEDDNAFGCKFCDKTIVGALSQIYRHAETRIHRINSLEYTARKIKFCKKTRKEIMETAALLDAKRKTAESQYALLISENNISDDTAIAILNFFKDIGKEPSILSEMKFIHN